MSIEIAVFAYDFAHRKTHDFLCELALAGIRPCVLAAPWRQLPHSIAPDPDAMVIGSAPALPTKQICTSLGFELHTVSHDDVEAISSLKERLGFNLAIISGARVLRRPLVELFDDGIVNFHPGPIPETSGPDSFFHMIRRRALPGVTTHYIDARVDAGRKIAFTPTKVAPNDPPELVRWNIYQTQIRALRALLALLATGDVPEGERIFDYQKNGFLLTADKESILEEFADWRDIVVSRACSRKGFNSDS